MHACVGTDMDYQIINNLVMDYPWAELLCRLRAGTNAPNAERMSDRGNGVAVLSVRAEPVRRKR